MKPNINSMKQQSSMSNDSQPTIWQQAGFKRSSRRHFLATCSWMTAMFGLSVKAFSQVSAANRPAESGASGGLKNGEKPGIANDGYVFKPRDTVPVSGIYDVMHDRIDGQEHAEQHQIMAQAGETFASCKVCQIWVRYRLHSTAEHIVARDYFVR
jgi:hypothetical protein